MEANKTITDKRTFPETHTRKEKLDLLKFKGLNIRTRSDKGGFTNSIPELFLESQVVDSTDSGKHKAILTMLSKAPEMLELLLKTKGHLENVVLGIKAIKEPKEEEKKLLAEIDAVLRQIID